MASLPRLSSMSALLLAMLNGVACSEPSSLATDSPKQSLLMEASHTSQSWPAARALQAYHSANRALKLSRRAKSNSTELGLLASFGLEAGARYRLRLGKEVSYFAKQRSGWYLGAMRGAMKGSAKDLRDVNSSYVAAFQPGQYGFNKSLTSWMIQPVPNSKAVKIIQPNGWYLTAYDEDHRDARDEDSTYAVIMNPRTPGLPEHDGEWLLQKTEYGAFRLSLVKNWKYLTVHRRSDRDQRGKEATYACVMHLAADVPRSDGRWLLEKVA